MKGSRLLRIAASAAAVGGALLAATDAGAASPYTLDVAIDGVPGTSPNGLFIAQTMKWDDDGLGFSFTRPTDRATKDFFLMLQGSTPAAKADRSVIFRQSLNGVVIVKLAGLNCHTDSVRESLNDPSGPQETVAFRCKQMTYTFQPTTAAGQANGPPVTVSFASVPATTR